MPVLLDQLTKVFMVIGDKVIMAGGGQYNFDNFESYDMTKEVVVRPRSLKKTFVDETRNSLNNMTKQQICDLALERYGVEFNLRTEKKLLITQYLEVQDS